MAGASHEVESEYIYSSDFSSFSKPVPHIPLLVTYHHYFSGILELSTIRCFTEIGVPMRLLAVAGSNTKELLPVKIRTSLIFPSPHFQPQPTRLPIPSLQISYAIHGRPI